MHYYSYSKLKRSRSCLGRSGFTLIELLVVIAIIGILMAMLFPAVQHIREAANRTTCLNQIRQIGYSLKNYDSAKKQLPPGWYTEDSDSAPGWGWMAFDLPFIEQQNLHRQIDFNTIVSDPSHQSVIVSHFSGLLCPSSIYSTPTFELDVEDDEGNVYPSVELARTHYVGCIGSTVPLQEMDDGYLCPSLRLLEGEGERLNGMFYQNSETKLKDLRDGSSFTIMVGERSANTFDSTWTGVVTDGLYAPWRVVGWTGEPPNNKEHSVNVHFHGFAQFNSTHAGGLTSFVFADGSTHVISDLIDPAVFLALGTIQGGEIIDHNDAF